MLETIDKLYPDCSNVNCLHNIIEPFAALFWALGIVLAHILQKVTQPLAWHPPTVVPARHYTAGVS